MEKKTRNQNQSPRKKQHASSFTWANSRPVEFRDWEKYHRDSVGKLNNFADLTNDPELLLKDMAIKRKREHDLHPKKKLKQTKVANVSINSIPYSGTGSSTNDDDDEIVWSDCDESEICKNVSLLEQSINGANANMNNEDDDEIVWSDCDESELSKNVSLLEQSINKAGKN